MWGSLTALILTFASIKVYQARKYESLLRNINFKGSNGIFSDRRLGI